MTERERLTALETEMERLLGNGQPGRITNIENDVKQHSRLLWLGMGGLYVVNVFIGLMAAGIIKFK